MVYVHLLFENKQQFSIIINNITGKLNITYLQI